MSNTDLYGKPLTKPPEMHLNKWQKRQATLLYHFASMEYLKGLKKLLDDFVKGVDLTLDGAGGRDELLVSQRWGVRDTAANFGTYGFAALKDFQKSVVRQIAEVSSEYYHATGSNQCQRLIGELSMGWSTPEEQERFEEGMALIAKYADRLDTTMEHAWTDGMFPDVWEEFAHLFKQIPKFRVRTDVVAESGKMPVRTGVYVPQDDPYGSLQFAWTGNSDGRLFDCSTFNDLCMQAINTVGRDKLWAHDPRLLSLVKQPQYFAAFKARNPFRYITEQEYLNDAGNARGFIYANGLISRPCKWYYVEVVNGEFEDAAELDALDAVAAPQPLRLRTEAGQACVRSGFYFTPAKTNSRRHFNQGDTMPSVGGDYGSTIWQWDINQEPPKFEQR
jgi:hypothetical protein